MPAYMTHAIHMTHAIPVLSVSDREIEVPGGALRIRFAEYATQEPQSHYDAPPRQPILNLAGDAGDVRAQCRTDICICDFYMAYRVRANMRVLHMQQMFFYHTEFNSNSISIPCFFLNVNTFEKLRALSIYITVYNLQVIEI